jgi:YD repeat-containing protein
VFDHDFEDFKRGVGAHAPEESWRGGRANTADVTTGTQYAYYTATDTKDDPCTTGTTEAYKQAGMIKLKTEADPDGAGAQIPRTTETIYDDAGRVVATRYNADAWTCTTYDTRGRVTQVSIPAFNGAAARTVTNNWAVSSNPLVISSSDSNGTITTTSDLLGRTTSYTDANGKTTTTSYDALGRVSSRTSPLGTEDFGYDNYNRLTSQKLDSIVIATPSYDTYGRLSGVTYPTAGSQALAITRDSLGRTTGMDYTLGNGTTHLTDTVTRSQSGQIISGTELGASKSYTYDKAGRLTSATIGANTYGFSFAAPSGTTCNQSSANLNSHKNSNRTSFTKNGVTTTYCYDQPDRLIASSDASVTSPVYDSHGNTTSIGTSPVTTFTYDSSDRNTTITEGTKSSALTRDVQGRVITRVYVKGTTTTNKYAFTGAEDSPDALLDSSGNVVEKYLQLPGGTLLTKRTSTSTFSLVNCHGDVMATTDASGANQTSFTYDPFGNPSSAMPTNTATGSTFGWVGQHEKDTETAFTLQPTEMGARVYLASIGSKWPSCPRRQVWIMSSLAACLTDC